MIKIAISIALLSVSFAATAGDLARTCNAIALHEEWECDATFQNSDMQKFCDANVLVDTEGNYYCNAIQDPDLKHFCNATSQVLPNECDLIVGSDMKNTCTAIAQLDSAACELIQGMDMKHFCNAVALQKTAECAEIQN